ncbi:hypothetical protein Chor_010138 [Crotalus horridus]
MLLLLLAWAAAGAREQGPLEFPRAVANLAVSGERFLVASGNCWYEVAPSLAWKEERYCEPQGSSCGTPVASVNKLLLPFGRDRLLICWTQPRGVCYVQNLTDGSSPEKLGDELVTYAPKGAAAGLLFCDNCSDWSLVVATTHKLNKCFDDPPASIANKAVFLIKVREKRVDEDSQVPMKEVYNLHFEDAFRWQKHFFFPYWYNNGNTEAKMLIARYKENAFEYNSQLLRCGAGSETKVLSSAYLEQRELWVGIFSSASGPATPTSTSLCIFALEELLKNAKSCSFSEPSTSEFHSESEPPDTCIKVIWPINNSTSLSHFNLVSVYATVLLNKIVLFLGTGNGQLLKIVLDDKMKPNCPEILYEIKEETPIFHRLELDPTDQNYIYLPSNNMMDESKDNILWNLFAPKSIGFHNSVQTKQYLCLRSFKCLNERNQKFRLSCTLKGECSFSSNSPNWINISYSINKCLKIYTSQLKNSKIRVRVDVNSFGLSEAHSRCKMLNARTNEILCDVNQRHLNCSCDINFEDRSEVQVSFISGTWKLSEIFEFDICSLSKTCSECNHTHCTWNAREKKCVISTMTCAKKVDCSSAINALNKKDNSATSKPIKIISIEPNYISTLGVSAFKRIKMNIVAKSIDSACKEFRFIRPLIQHMHPDHFTCHKNNFECSFTTPAVKMEKGPKIINIILKVKNINISCGDFQYYPDPKFLHYELITDLEPDLELKIHKKKDNLNLSRHELEVFLSDKNLINITFNVQNISKTATRNIIHCRARQEKNLISKINKSSMKVYVKVGNFVYEVPNENKNYSFFYILLLIPIVIVVAFFVTQRKSKQLNRKLSEHLELLECELRKEIREGFVELQVEKLDIIDSFGTIPFLDYKHFVLRTFLPETIDISSIFIEDSNEPLETVGEPFFLLVTTLNQRIIKGPVDVITCKALYTLNEDWLLWQAPEFSTVVLNVVFENIQENEASGAIQNIQVKVLDCDTIGQAKEKILQAFLNKNGSLYGLQLREMGLTLESVSQTKELLDVDGSSVILENGVTKLNTIGHYEISDGAKMKVFKKKQDISADGEYSEDYCHLILPDAEAAKETQSAKHKGKQKFKVKEMYLTKLLSTKVAIHSTVEKLFRSIWNLPNNKAPVAIKYFFDFLDAQAENKKITDPDVVHIWKTNSLPLRFWEAPTNKLLYAKDIPLYKEEVKAFYKAIRDLPPLPRAELEEFLILESQKHENEFNETEALNKIYQYITRYFDKILNKLETERGFEEARQQLLNIKGLMDEKKKCKWA